MILYAFLGLAIAGVLGALIYAFRPRTTGHITSTVSAQIDPFTLQEPWRRFVQAAQSSRRRIDDVVANRADGPTRDRLSDTVRQVDDIVARIWEAAQEGHALSGASRLANLPSLERRLSQTELELAEAVEDRKAPIESSLISLRGSVDAAKRLSGERDAAIDRLREMNERLDELVVRGIEVSVTNVSPTDADSLRADLDAMVVDLEGLRQGLAETKRLATA
jgi:hypothetical protein